MTDAVLVRTELWTPFWWRAVERKIYESSSIRALRGDDSPFWPSQEGNVFVLLGRRTLGSELDSEKMAQDELIQALVVPCVHVLLYDVLVQGPDLFDQQLKGRDGVF